MTTKIKTTNQKTAPITAVGEIKVFRIHFVFGPGTIINWEFGTIGVQTLFSGPD